MLGYEGGYARMRGTSQGFGNRSRNVDQVQTVGMDGEISEYV